MCSSIGKSFVKIEADKFLVPAKNVSTKKNETGEEIFRKDEKKISDTSGQTSKAKLYNFIEESKEHFGNLTGHKIVSVTSKVISEEIGKKISEKAVAKTVGKVVTSVARNYSGSFGKTLIKSVGKNVAQTVVTTGAENLTIKTLEKTAEKTALKGSSELSKKISAAVPVIGTAMEIGFTIWDARSAYKLTKNQNVSTVSKVLAWATVGLDVVSAVGVATGVGAPVGWMATGLSVGTAVLSDMLK